jgi:hypothetical protein
VDRKCKFGATFDVVMLSGRRLIACLRSSDFRNQGLRQFAGQITQEPSTRRDVVQMSRCCDACYAQRLENTVLPSGDSPYGNGCGSRRIAGVSGARHQPPLFRANRPFIVTEIPHRAPYGLFFIPNSGRRDSLRINLHDH